jgi:hypothetical protein
MQKMRQEIEGMKMQTVKEKQIALAVSMAAERGIPIDIAKKNIGINDEETIANIDALAGVLKSWQEGAVNKAIADRLGNNGAPSRGTNPDARKSLTEQYARLMNSGMPGDRERANALFIQLQNMS